MVVTPELRAQILRLYLAEHWRVSTIARQLHLHRDTVRRVLAISSVLRALATEPPHLIDPFVPFIKETLAKFPTLAASRLLAKVQERGYGGGSSHFRHLVAPLRPRPATEAYLRLRTLPAEQAQVNGVLCRARHSSRPTTPSSGTCLVIQNFIDDTLCPREKWW